MNFKEFLQISAKEIDSKKTERRIDIAIFLTLLKEETVLKKDRLKVNKIRKRFLHKAGGLSIFEIRYLLTLPESEIVLSDLHSNLSGYRQKFNKEIKYFSRPVYGKPTLAKSDYSVIDYFAKTNFSKVISKRFELKFPDIIVRKDLYPRRVSSPLVRQKIWEYTQLDEIELGKKPLIVNQKNELIDGYLRLSAMKNQQKSENFCVLVTSVYTQSDKHLKEQMYKYNSKHGTPYEFAMKKEYAQDLIEEGKDIKDVVKITGVSRPTIQKWTKRIRQDKKSKLTKKVLDLKDSGYTQHRIAVSLNISQATVSNILVKTKNIKNAKGSKSNKPSKIFKSNSWVAVSNISENLSDKVIDEYFGKCHELYLENLLYYHTNKGDIVLDLFAGTASTFVVCDRMMRDCRCYDRIPFGGKEYLIQKHDINNGLPQNLPVKIKLVFLDPPYWRQARKQYSFEPEDLANMELDEYNKSMAQLFDAIKHSSNNSIYIEKVAILIGPTIYDPPNFVFVDHVFDFHSMLNDKYKIAERYHCFFPTNFRMPKKERRCTIVKRDLIIYDRIR